MTLNKHQMETALDQVSDIKKSVSEKLDRWDAARGSDPTEADAALRSILVELRDASYAHGMVLDSLVKNLP